MTSQKKQQMWQQKGTDFISHAWKNRVACMSDSDSTTLEKWNLYNINILTYKMGIIIVPTL